MRRRDAGNVQLLMNRFRDSGAAGPTSFNRDKLGNHRLSDSLKLRVVALLCEKYSDFQTAHLSLSFRSTEHQTPIITLKL